MTIEGRRAATPSRLDWTSFRNEGMDVGVVDDGQSRQLVSLNTNYIHITHQCQPPDMTFNVCSSSKPVGNNYNSISLKTFVITGLL